MVVKSIKEEVKRRGLTLVEILVAIALMGASIIPIWLMFFQSQANIIEGQLESQIVNLGTAFLGQVRGMNPRTLTPTAGALPIAPLPSDEYLLPGFPPNVRIILPPWPANDCQLTYEIQVFNPLPIEGKLVSLTIDWKAKGRSHQITFPELVTDD